MPRKKPEVSSPTSDSSINSRRKNVSLAEALEVIRANGLSLASPKDETIAKLQQESRELLGVVKEPLKKNKIQKETPQPKEIHIHLNFPHCLGKESYGPGDVVLPIEKADIAAVLKQNDQLATAHEIDVMTPRQPKSYVIVQRQGKNMAVRMRDDFLNNMGNFNSSLYYDDFSERNIF